MLNSLDAVKALTNAYAKTYDETCIKADTEDEVMKIFDYILIGKVLPNIMKTHCMGFHLNISYDASTEKLFVNDKFGCSTFAFEGSLDVYERLREKFEADSDVCVDNNHINYFEVSYFGQTVNDD